MDRKQYLCNGRAKWRMASRLFKTHQAMADVRIVSAQQRHLEQR
jgi:hypothetical protein